MSRENKPYGVLDCETDKVDFTRLFCVGFTEADGYTWHIKLDWSLYGETQELQNYADTEEFKVIQDFIDSRYVVIHNACFDITVLSAFGFDFSNAEFDDTMMMSYLTYPLSPQGHSLGAWGERLGHPKIEFKDFSQYTEEMGRYCEQDCRTTQQLHMVLLPELQDDKKAFDLYEKVDKPMILATVILQKNGIKVDKETWLKQTEELEVLKDETLNEVRGIVPYAPGTSSKVKTERSPELVANPRSLGDLQNCEGKYYYVGQDDSGKHIYKKFVSFNPDSNYQIIWALQEFYGWRPTEFTPNGNPRCDDDILSNLDDPLSECLCRYATLSKLTGTYGRSFIDSVRSDGRIHANFNPCVTATGRYSSSNPNLRY